MLKNLYNPVNKTMKPYENHPGILTISKKKKKIPWKTCLKSNRTLNENSAFCTHFIHDSKFPEILNLA